MTISTTQTKTIEAPVHSPPDELADGVELLGLYRGSGFKDPRFLVRRPDGQVIQLPQLLYSIVEGIAAGHDHGAIADRAGETIKRAVSAADVRLLIDEKLRPLGLIRSADGALVPASPKTDAMFALKYKSAVIPASVVRVIAATFRPLFLPPVVVAVLGTAVALDIWVFGVHGLAQGLRAALYQPTTLLLMLGLVVLSAVFHECGHAAATRYGGAQPGVMGAGLYLVWPALYTDITDSYRLGRAGRLRADLGGVYFNTIFMLLTGGAYFLTGFEPLLLMIPLQQLEIVHQLLPFLRLDGYYIISDLTGVPDILSRVKPTLKSLVPGLDVDQRVSELKPWARAVMTLYLLLLIPVLCLLFSLMALAAPRVFATAWDAFGVTWQRAQEAIDRRHAVLSLVSLIQLGVLALSPIGLALTLVRAGRRIAGGVWRGTATRPVTRAVVVAATSATAAAFLVSWWLQGAYRPVALGERGTLSSRVFDVHAAVGRQTHDRSVQDPRQSGAPRPPSSLYGGAISPRGGNRSDPDIGSSVAHPPFKRGTARGGSTRSSQPMTIESLPETSSSWTEPLVGSTTEETTTTPNVTEPPPATTAESTTTTETTPTP